VDWSACAILNGARLRPTAAYEDDADSHDNAHREIRRCDQPPAAGVCHVTVTQVLMGALLTALLADFVRRNALCRGVLLRNATALAGSAILAVGVVLLLVVPIWKRMPDASTLWCGTYMNRSESWPAACDDAWDLYDQRFNAARWPLLAGVTLIGAGNVIRLVNWVRRSTAI
jgi:hypothetical protein